MQSDIEWLCAWAVEQCDDEWEHGNAIALDMLDNPGWAVRIDLSNSPMAGKVVPRLKEGFSDEDRWLHCRIENGVFIGSGDLTQLPRILSVFREWAQP